MERLHIRDGTIHFGEEPLGPKEILLADCGELCSVSDGIKHLLLPHRFDLVFAVGERVAAGEIKYPEDLVTSHQRRRLARQLNNIRECADIGILFLRDFATWQVIEEQNFAERRNRSYRRRILWQDLAGFQTQDGYVLHLPADDGEAVEFIQWYQQALATSGSRVFAGTDRGPKAEGPGKKLQIIPGVGPKKAEALMLEYGTPFRVGQASRLASFEVKFGVSLAKKVRAWFHETA